MLTKTEDLAIEEEYLDIFDESKHYERAMNQLHDKYVVFAKILLSNSNRGIQKLISELSSKIKKCQKEVEDNSKNQLARQDK